nr:MAG TPA: hypothetical protein [Caudoviricetes sp.]
MEQTLQQANISTKSLFYLIILNNHERRNKILHVFK